MLPQEVVYCINRWYIASRGSVLHQQVVYCLKRGCIASRGGVLPQEVVYWLKGWCKLNHGVDCSPKSHLSHNPFQALPQTEWPTVQFSHTSMRMMSCGNCPYSCQFSTFYHQFSDTQNFWSNLLYIVKKQFGLKQVF